VSDHARWEKLMPRTEPSATSSALTDDPLYATFARLVRLQTKLWNDLDHRLRTNHGVTLADLTTLDVVASTEGCRVQDIVDTLHITVGGASKVVDRLVKADVVIRTTNPHDRRSSVLLATAEGRALLRRTATDVNDLLSTQLAGALSGSQLADLDQLLSIVYEAAPELKEGEHP
jgi:DNA-binding MarR family transcriptional regulator